MFRQLVPLKGRAQTQDLADEPLCFSWLERSVIPAEAYGAGLRDSTLCLLSRFWVLRFGEEQDRGWKIRVGTGRSASGCRTGMKLRPSGLRKKAVSLLSFSHPLFGKFAAVAARVGPILGLSWASKP